MVGKVGLQVVKDLLRLRHHLPQVRVHLLTLVCQTTKPVHILPDLLFAQILLGGCIYRKVPRLEL